MMKRSLYLIFSICFYLTLGWLAYEVYHLFQLSAGDRGDVAESRLFLPALGLTLSSMAAFWAKGQFPRRERWMAVFASLRGGKMEDPEENTRHRNLGRMLLGLDFSISLAGFFFFYAVGWLGIWMVLSTLAILLGLMSVQGFILKAFQTSGSTPLYSGPLMVKLHDLQPGVPPIEQRWDEGEERVVLQSAFKTRKLMDTLFLVALIVSVWQNQLFAFFMIAAIWTVLYFYYYFQIHRNMVY